MMKTAGKNGGVVAFKKAINQKIHRVFDIGDRCRILFRVNGNFITRSFRGTRCYSPVCGPRQGPVTTPPPFCTERSNRLVNGALRARIDLFARNGETEDIRRIDGLLFDYLCHGETRSLPAVQIIQQRS